MLVFLIQKYNSVKKDNNEYAIRQNLGQACGFES